MLQAPSYEKLTAALDNLETSAMLAGLPKNLTSLNREALYILREVIASSAEAEPPAEPPYRHRLRVPRRPPRRSRGSGEDSSSALPYSETVGGNDLAFTADYIAGETLQLLSDATWHPALGAPYRWWRTRRLSRVMETRARPGPRLRDKRRWERTAIRKAKQDRSDRRRAAAARRTATQADKLANNQHHTQGD